MQIKNIPATKMCGRLSTSRLHNMYFYVSPKDGSVRYRELERSFKMQPRHNRGDRNNGVENGKSSSMLLRLKG
jgi:hypothetical protein